MEKNYFAELNSINVNDKVEKKNGLSYVSWAFAWAEIKKKHPDATYTIYENADGWFYHTDGKTAWVKTGVTVNGIEHIEYLPVMDYKNKSIPVDAVTSFDVNKTIQRSLTKACARHGLGLYIYAGEDIPEGPGRKEILEHTEEVRNQTIGPARARALEKHLSDNGILVDTIYFLYKVKALAELTEAQHKNITENISKILEAQIGNEGKTA